MLQRLLLVFALLCCTLIQVAAQRRARIYGTIRDAQGQPIELAAVRIAGTTQATVADLKGNYSLSFARTDSVTIIYSMIGHETRKRTLRSPKDSLRIDIILPSFGQMLGEATVKGNGVQTSTTQRISPTDLRRAPSTTGNGVEEIIATQAGVSTHNELSSQYNVRGGSFDENVVYLNGIEVYRPLLVRSGQQEGLSIINSDMVESIAFSSGGFEARYGDKMSSVLDITYKKPSRLEATVGASLLGAHAYVGWGKQHFSLLSSIRYKTTRHLLSTLDTGGEYKPDFFDYQLFASWRPNAQWSLEALGNASVNHYQFQPQSRETHFGTMFEPKSFKVYFDGQEKDLFNTFFGAATLTRHFSPHTFLALQISSFSTREKETYDIQGQYWLNEATSQEELGVGTYMEHARNALRASVIDVGLRFRTKQGAHTLQTGVNWKPEGVCENSKEWEMRDSMGYSLPHQTDKLQLIYSLRSHQELRTQRWEAYAQDTWRPHTKLGLWNLTYGLRLSHWNWNGETLLSPRASIGFLPAANDRLTLRFGTGFYYQAPFFKELRDTTLRHGEAIVRLNPQILSQRSLHFVLGGDYTFRMAGRPFKLTTEIYYKALSRLIPYSIDNVRVVYYGRNLAQGYTTGIDFKLFGEFVPGTDSWLTFSLMQTREKIGQTWLPRPTDQRYNLSLHFTDYFPGSTRWALTLRAALAGGLPFGPPHSDRKQHTFRSPSYKRVDAGLSYLIVKRQSQQRPLKGWNRYLRSAWVGLDCFNLLGIRNVNSYYWITDITNTRFAVPNYLTGRQLNLRFWCEF